MSMFFIIFFSVYAGINLFVGLNLFFGMGVIGPWRWAVMGLLVLLVASYPAGRIMAGESPDALTHILEVVGSWYLAVMVPLLFLYAVADIIWLALPKRAIAAVGIGWGGVTVVILVITVLITLYGHINSRIVRTQEVTIDIPKSVPGRTELTVAFASDIHIGAVMNLSRLEAILETINAANPDVVFLGGDIIDGRADGISEPAMGSGLCIIDAPLGVYSVHGNHEHYRGADHMQEILERSQVNVLRDETVEIVPGVWLVGREDLAVEQRYGASRMPLSDLVQNIPEGAVRLMMDHQPRNLDDAVNNGIDLQLSGHTHNGQMTPFQLITKKIYEVSWGYKKKGDTHVYVSSGAGTWGPPVRTGNVPEVVKLTIRFTGS